MFCEPIGILHCDRELRFQAPRQASDGEAVVELVAGMEQAVRDLDGFSRIWLVWCFHLNSGWRPMVMPPRGGGRRGVLATRSPHRPNPIGMSAVPLLRVKGRKLWIGEHDLVDGTPILDIKPYLPRYDSFPEESEGWLAEMEQRPVYEIEFSEIMAAWFVEHPEELRVAAVLQENPAPGHRRRITDMKDGRLRLASGPWRFFFRVDGQKILIESVESVLFQGNPLS